MTTAPGFAHLAVWTIAMLSVAGVIVRPFRWPEAVWACGGAALIVALGLLSPTAALVAVGKGTDVYLFRTGKMLLSEVARREGLFDRVAEAAVKHAGGSPRRLFLLVYGVGVVVTTFLSNDATAVVMTPAVYAATRKAGVEPLPYLFGCAFVANAASFVLPISNPANLVLYAGHTPALGHWLASFGPPSLVAVAVTFLLLRVLEGRGLADRCDAVVTASRLSAGAWTALAGLGATAVALTVVSALGAPLGAPTCLMGVLTSAIVLVRKREPPWATLRAVPWAVLPLVAGLFVLVEALGSTGVIAGLAHELREGLRATPQGMPWISGSLIALASNLINNLPAGLIAGSTLQQVHAPTRVVDALLIGVDLGPNLSVTGSLATILWLTAIRREGEDVGFWRFLKVGAVLTPPALALAWAARLLWP